MPENDDVNAQVGAINDSNPETTSQPDSRERARAYWRANIRLLLSLLVVWFLVSFGAGILFADALNSFVVGGFPLGFWFAQQGSIYVYVVLIFVYATQMKRLEHQFGVDDDEEGRA
jgi:putative solute:sodium symporter small subunit